VSHFVSFLFFPGLRDLIVLAVNTAKIAVAEENISSTVFSRQARLFAEVRGVRRDDREPSRITRRDLIVHAIVAAELRANRARAKHRFELFDSLVKLILR
jgi:hypothetical protein